MKYKLETWKYSVEGEYESEEQAIKDLGDKYMRCSKCDPPHEHPAYLLNNSTHKIDVSTVAKCVYLSVFEKVYDVEQWIQKYVQLHIYPFKKEHWWESKNGFEFEECEFRYEIKNKRD